MGGHKQWWLTLVLSIACAALVSASVASAEGHGARGPLTPLPPQRSAPAYLPPSGKVFAGVTGGPGVAPFQDLVGFHPPVFEYYQTWNTHTQWLAPKGSPQLTRMGLAMVTQTGHLQRGVISTWGISRGHSDTFLVNMNRNLAHADRIFYIRIMPEMNGWWNAYCPYNHNGSKRSRSESTRNFIAAWRRTVLILRGGPVKTINKKLHALRLPPIKATVSGTRVLARPKVTFIWGPMMHGGPEIPQLEPEHFWPGKSYVDWIATDTFSTWARFTWMNQFFRRFRGKPFAIAEWGVQGKDDPRFVRRMFEWVRAHPRVRMINYYESYTPSSPYNPIHFPRSVRLLRRELRSSRFPQYAPEYQPKCGPLLRLKRQCSR